MQISKDKKFLALVIGFVAFISAAAVFNLYSFLNKNGGLSSIRARFPARLHIVKIVEVNCAHCFDIDKLLDQIKKANARVKSERVLNREEPEAQSLITK